MAKKHTTAKEVAKLFNQLTEDEQRRVIVDPACQLMHRAIDLIQGSYVAYMLSHRWASDQMNLLRAIGRADKYDFSTLQECVK